MPRQRLPLSLQLLCASALAFVPTCVSAQMPPTEEPTEDTESGSLVSRLFSWPPIIFRDTEYGDVSHPGTPEAPSRGYPHYDSPSRRYGLWYRPKSFGLGECERCWPSAFRPRGYGHLFARPHTCYRIDYHPYTLKKTSSGFGPSYYRRQADPHCHPYQVLGLGGER